MFIFYISLYYTAPAAFLKIVAFIAVKKNPAIQNFFICFSIEMISKLRWHPKFNLGQFNAYKLMFSTKSSMEKKKKLIAVFFTRDECNCL